MATIFRCDRCARESKDDDHLEKLSFEYKDRYNSPGFCKTDLCNNCRVQLVEWLKPMPQVAEK